jgi:hypothetical protein
MNPNNVSAAEWDNLARGAEYKLAVFTRLWRDQWPEGVQYPNLVALDRYHKAKENRMETRMDLYRRSLGDETSVSLAEWEEALEGVDLENRNTLQYLELYQRAKDRDGKAKETGAQERSNDAAALDEKKRP